MRENRTKPTQRNISTYLESIEPPRRKQDALTLLPLMKQWTGLEPVAWDGGLAGKSENLIIGFGFYADKNGNDWMLTGFSPRKAHLAIYIMPGYSTFGDQLERLGKHKTTVSCLYLTNLSNNNLEALEEIVRGGINIMKSIYDWRPS